MRMPPLLFVACLLTLQCGCAERRTPSQPVEATRPAQDAPFPAEAAPDATPEAARAPADAGAPRSSRVRSHVILDGEKTQVEWSDGDTFRIRSGPHAGTNARLQGYNTLEDYGPVHRWGTWTREELLGNAKASGDRVRGEEWTCKSVGDKDRYGRLLVSCPEAGLTLVREGYAFAFSVDGPAPAQWQAAQKEAREARRGMWAKGTPRHVISSLHSADEGNAYNRLVDTVTGHAQTRPHQDRYELCQEVCLGEGADASCMVYVPFERRYKNRPDCLPGKAD